MCGIVRVERKQDACELLLSNKLCLEPKWLLEKGITAIISEQISHPIISYRPHIIHVELQFSSVQFSFSSVQYQFQSSSVTMLLMNVTLPSTTTLKTLHQFIWNTSSC